MYRQKIFEKNSQKTSLVFLNNSAPRDPLNLFKFTDIGTSNTRSTKTMKHCVLIARMNCRSIPNNSN